MQTIASRANAPALLADLKSMFELISNVESSKKAIKELHEGVAAYEKVRIASEAEIAALAKIKSEFVAQHDAHEASVAALSLEKSRIHELEKSISERERGLSLKIVKLAKDQSEFHLLKDEAEKDFLARNSALNKAKNEASESLLKANALSKEFENKLALIKAAVGE